MSVRPRFRLSLLGCRALLLLYPRAFRARFRDDILDDFAEMLAAHTRRRPIAGRLQCSTRVAADALRSAPREHLDEWRRRLREARSPVMTPLPDFEKGKRMTFLRELQDAWQTLRRSPSFSLPVVLSIAFAIGANVAAFSIVDTLALRSLPIREPQQLYRVVHGGDRGVREGANYGWYETVRDRMSGLDGVVLQDDGIMKVVIDDQVESVNGLRVSRGYFAVLGLAPAAGRLLDESDADASPAPVAVIGHSYWTRRFGRNPGIIGKSIVLDQVPHVIVGVTPAAFSGLQTGQRIDVTVPMDPAEFREGWSSSPLLVRLEAGRTPESATAELTTLFQQFFSGPDPMGFGRPVPADERAGRFKFVQLHSVRSGLGALREQFMAPAVALSVLAAVMLLLACANWATLSLAKAAARRRELTIRLALGSTRWRLARSLLVESLLLAIAGGGLGFLGAWWGVGLVTAYLPVLGWQGFELAIEPNLRVGLFSLLLSLTTGALFGLAPAWLTSRVQAGDLRTAGAIDDGRRLGIDRGLVAAQVALSMVLVIAATFFAITLRNLKEQSLGFSSRGVVTFTLDADGTDLEGEPLTATHRQVLDRLRALPGVERATLATIPPLSGNQDGKPFSIPGFEPKSPADMAAQVNTVAPDYLETFGIRLVAGRSISSDDTAAAPRVVLVSTRTARDYFGTSNPIGRRMEIRGATTTSVEIVGVVDDVRDRDLRTAASRMFYVPFFQRNAEGEYTFAVRATGNPAELMRAIRWEVHAIVPQIPVLGMETMDQRIDARLANERLLAAVAGAFGGLALLLAGVGIYGVVAYIVTRRTPELGLRMALGAGKGHVVWLVSRGTVAAVAVGVVVGLFVAVMARTTIAALLFGLPATDVRVYVGGVAFLCLVGIAAGLAPAIRAMGVDPLTTLRRE